LSLCGHFVFIVLPISWSYCLGCICQHGECTFWNHPLWKGNVRIRLL